MKKQKRIERKRN